MVIRIACAYRTVATNAILIVASVLPIHLQAVKRCAVHWVKRKARNTPSKQQMRTDSTRKWQIEWDKSETGQWTRWLIPDLQPWVTITFSMVNYHITQLLMGHGCFGHYLYRLFRRLDTLVCYDCQALIDDAEYTTYDQNRLILLLNL